MNSYREELDWVFSGKDVRAGPRHVKWLKSIEVRQIVD